MSESFLASRRAMEPLRVGDLALAHSSGRHGPQSQDEQPRNLLGSRFHERHRGPERTATTGPSPRYLRISNRAAPPTTTAPCSRPTGVRTRTSPFSPRAQERLLEPVAPGGRLRAGRGIPGVPRAWSVGAFAQAEVPPVSVRADAVLNESREPSVLVRRVGRPQVRGSLLAAEACPSVEPWLLPVSSAIETISPPSMKAINTATSAEVGKDGMSRRAPLTSVAAPWYW
jgi:hypothetical protein